MKKSLKIILITMLLLALVLSLGIVALMLPPVQKAVLLRSLPDGAALEHVRLGLSGGSLRGLSMPLEADGRIEIPEASFGYKPMRFFTSRTAHLSYLRARHISIVLPQSDDPVVVEEKEPLDYKALQREVERSLRESADVPFKWVLDELALDGDLRLPGLGLFRFEIYGGGFAPGETGELRTELESLEFVNALVEDSIALKMLAKLEIDQSNKGSVGRVFINMDGGILSTSGKKMVTTKGSVNLAIADEAGSSHLTVNLDADLADTKLLGEPLNVLNDVGLRFDLDLAASGAVFTLNKAVVDLRVDGQTRVNAELQHPIRIGEALPANLALFVLSLHELKPEWIQLFMNDGMRLSGSPLSAELVINADGRGGFLLSPTELELLSLAISDDEGETLLDELGIHLALRGGVHPEGAFQIEIAPFLINVAGERVFSTNLSTTGDFSNSTLALRSDFVMELEEMMRQPVARDWQSLFPAGWQSLNGELELALDDEWLQLKQFQTRLQTHAGAAVVALTLVQPGRIALDGSRWQVEDAEADFAQLRLNDLRLAWLDSFLPEGMRLHEQGVVALLRIKAVDDHLVVHTAEPIRIKEIALDLNNEPALRDAEILLNFNVNVLADRIVLRELKTSISSRGAILIEQTLQAELPMREWELDLEGMLFSGELTANLPILSQQPVIAKQIQPLRGGFLTTRFSGAGLGQSLELNIHAPYLQGTSEDTVTLVGDISVKSTSAQQWTIVSQFDWGLAGVTDGSSLGTDLKLRQLPEVLDLQGEIHAPKLRMVDIEVLQGAFAPVAPTAAPSTPRTPSTPPSKEPAPDEVFAAVPWAGMSADIKLRVDAFEQAKDVSISAISGQLTLDEQAARVLEFKAQLGRGNVEANASLLRKPEIKRFVLQADVGFEGLEPGWLLGREGDLKGTFDGSIRVRGQGASPESAIEAAEVTATVEGRDGLMTLLNLESPTTGAAMLGLSLLGAHTRQPGITAFTRAIPYFNQLHFDRFGLDLRRGADGLLELNELAVVGPDLSISGNGSVAPGKWQDMLNQPMRLTVDLGAKGQLADSLQTLGLVRSSAGVDGFKPATQQLSIGGTLANPDSRSVQEWLWQAALGAFSGGRSQQQTETTNREAETTTDSPTRTDAKPRQEPLREEIETGRRIIEGLFGR